MRSPHRAHLPALLLTEGSPLLNQNTARVLWGERKAIDKEPEDDTRLANTYASPNQREMFMS